KLNNALGQALLALRLGKRRIVAETGAGQHGVAAATVCARFGLDCVVYMGAEDMRRQRPNVERMGLLGAGVRAVEFGTRTLEEAVEAFRRLARTEGIVPALEPAHALARVAELDEQLVLLNLSGRGDKDLEEVLAR